MTSTERPSPADAALQRARHDLRLGLSRDQRRLHGLWSAWSRAIEDVAKRTAFEQALHASIQARQRRADGKPSPQFEDELPITREAEQIIASIRKHRVVVIAGETGSGKTTQLPKLCLAAGRGEAGIIGCTQPRRIACG